MSVSVRVPFCCSHNHKNITHLTIDQWLFFFQSGQFSYPGKTFMISQYPNPNVNIDDNSNFLSKFCSTKSSVSGFQNFPGWPFITSGSQKIWKKNCVIHKVDPMIVHTGYNIWASACLYLFFAEPNLIVNTNLLFILCRFYCQRSKINKTKCQ